MRLAVRTSGAQACGYVIVNVRVRACTMHTYVGTGIRGSVWFDRGWSADVNNRALGI